MKNKQAIVIAAFILLGCFAQSQAQSDRNFVATTGVDSPTCGAFASPCRSFNVALPKTNAGGEVIALDSGIYDGVNIVISISVTLAAAPGAHVELSNNNNSTDRITVNAQSSDTVILRNLYLSRQSGETSGGYGIGVRRVGVLQIENCVIDGFTEGIDFSLDTSAQVSIKDTIIRNSTTNGISFFTSAGLIRASIDKSHFDHNGTAGNYNGVNLVQRARVTVRDSVATGNTGAGFYVIGGDLNLESCESANNRDGVVAAGNSMNTGNALVSNSIVTNNSRYGFYEFGGVFHSLGNNVVRRSGTANTSGTISVVTGT